MKKKKVKLFICYTIIFTIISLIIFYPFYSNGRSLILDDDGSRQHYIIFCDYISSLKNFLLGNGFSTFKWSIGLGENVIAQYAYYIIGDVFAYIGLLFPKSAYPFVYSFLIIVRIFFVGISMLCYCKYKNVSNYKSLLSAIIYTFCSFIIFASARHPYFTNPMILFPLLMIGVEKLIREDKKVFLTVIFFFCLLSNFYFSYIMFVMGILYALVMYIFDVKQKSIKEFFILVLKAFICFAIAFLMASSLLIPVVYTFLNMTSLNRNTLTGLYPIQYYYDFIRTFTIVKSYDFWTQIGVSSLVIILIPIIFKNYKEHKKEVVLFIIMFGMLLIPIFGSIMNGLSFPSNRWIFTFIFLLAWFIPCALKDNIEFSIKEIILMSFTTLIYFALYFKFSYSLDKFEYKMELLFALLILAIFILNYRFKINKISKYALLIVVCLNVTFNGLYYYSSHGYRYAKWFLQYKNLDYVYKESGGSFNDFDKIIDKIKESDDGFYRINKYPNSYGNLSILYNYNSFDSYLSLVNGAQVNYSKDLNNSVRRTSNSIGNFDNRTIATNILGGKYFIVDKSNLGKVPYGYYDYMDFNNGNTLALKNKYYLSPFIFYDNYILEKDYNKLAPLYKEESNLSTVSIKSKDVVGGLDINNNMPNIDNIKKLDCKITDRDRNNSHFELDCDGVSNSNIFVNIVGFEILKSYDGSYSYDITAVRDEIVSSKDFANKFVSAYYQEIPELLLNLGYASSNDSNKIVIDARKDREYKVSRIEVYAVSMDSYSEKIEALSKNKFEIEDWKDGYIKGKINNDVDGILQLSTGYSKGWNVLVDGKRVNTFATDKSFLSIALPSGEHVIEYKYNEPFKEACSFATIVGFIAFGILCYYDKKRTLT